MVEHNSDGMDPTGLTVEQAARLLGTKADVIRRHIAGGLPAGPGGTVNLITYAAWLNVPTDGAAQESET